MLSWRGVNRRFARSSAWEGSWPVGVASSRGKNCGAKVSCFWYTSGPVTPAAGGTPVASSSARFTPMSNLSSSASRSLRRSRLQSLAFDLTKRCPALGGNPGDCPLFGVRQLTPARRRRWLEGLTDEDLRYLSLYHQLCYQELGAGRAG